MQFRKVWRIRNDIRRLLYNQGRPVEDLKTLARRLGRLLNKKYKTQFHWNPSPVLGREHLVFTGHFDCYEQRSISIWLNSHPDSLHYTFGENGMISWERFVNDLSECIMHEKVHELQWRKHHNRGRFNRTLSGNPEYDYYSDPDEVDAYAWSFASEIFDHHINFRNIPNLEVDFSLWWNYANIFPADHPVRKRLLKKTYVILTLALENKVK